MAYKSDLYNRQHYIYRAYIGDELAYIGVTTNPAGRFSKHSRKPWWDQVTEITFEEAENRLRAFDSERTYIITERPKYNVAYLNGRF